MIVDASVYNLWTGTACTAMTRIHLAWNRYGALGRDGGVSQVDDSGHGNHLLGYIGFLQIKTVTCILVTIATQGFSYKRSFLIFCWTSYLRLVKDVLIQRPRCWHLHSFPDFLFQIMQKLFSFFWPCYFNDNFAVFSMLNLSKRQRHSKGSSQVDFHLLSGKNNSLLGRSRSEKALSGKFSGNPSLSAWYRSAELLISSTLYTATCSTFDLILWPLHSGPYTQKCVSVCCI